VITPVTAREASQVAVGIAAAEANPDQPSRQGPENLREAGDSPTGNQRPHSRPRAESRVAPRFGVSAER